MDARTTTWADRLLLLNLILQVFDGVATYHGIAVWGEANPFIRNLVPHLGVGLTLAMFKLQASALLLFVWAAGTRRLAVPCMLTTAASYAALSFVPWVGAFWSQLTV